MSDINVKEFVKPEKKKREKKRNHTGIKVLTIISGIVILGFGVAIVIQEITDWGAEHQIVWQRVVDVAVRSPVRIDTRPKQIVISPIAQKVAESKLTPTEQVIVNKWDGDFRTAMLAVAIFDCGESSLNTDAVSKTGDLGVAQINWPANGKTIKEKLNYGPADMFEVSKNIDAAYLIWDRGDGIEGNKEGNFNAWIGFTSGAYTRCFE